MKLSRFGIMMIGMAIISTTALGAVEVIDSFNDGDFTNNPTWTGDTGSWEIVTDSDVAGGATNSNTLRLMASGSDTQYLSTQRLGSWSTEQSWGFWLGRRSQAATASNHSIVWLWANETNLESSTVDGYRIKFGDNKSGGDEIRLQRVDDGVDTTILTASGTVTNGLTGIGFLVRVTRTSASEWMLFTSNLPTANSTGSVATDIPSTANTSINQGSVTDDTFTNFDNGYFGFMAVHTSSGGAPTGAEFDQLYFDTDSDSSLPVELSLFTATITTNAIKIYWKTESETNNLGFWIYRSEQRDGKYVKINPVLIRGAGTSGTSHEYTLKDMDAEKGTVYYYYIEDVALDGATSQSPIIRTRDLTNLIGKRLLTWGKLKRAK
ncbi:hypothetical protein IH992_20855 [Candidatus Poribacteria bacterium]|nr:hypothetical protein [Candidatus Poribacteria bacterium]